MGLILDANTVKIFRIRRNKYQPYLVGSLEKRGAQLKKEKRTCRPKEAQSTTGLRRRKEVVKFIFGFSFVQKSSSKKEIPGVPDAQPNEVTTTG